MLPIDRQKQIRKLIQKDKTLKISELSKRFNVSEMTVYRDIKPLLEEGLISKTPGGMSLNEKKHQTLSDQSHCVYCHKPNHSKMIYRLILTDDKIESTCCAHCGLLRHRQLGEKVSHAICRDFFMDTTISASLAWYVMDTTLNIACCQPQVLTFEQKEHADKFVKGFAGKVYSFHEVIGVIFQKMSGNDSCCST